MRELLAQSPEKFAAALRDGGHRRALLAWDRTSGSLRVWPEHLEELAEFVADPASGYRGHEAVFLEAGSRTGALFAAFVHRTARGQAQGGLRRLAYPTLRDVLVDGLRLSLAMGRKNALAGLWWGGGKGIVAQPQGEDDPDPARRRLLYREYGTFVTSLRGCYVTAEDVGTSPRDLVEVAQRTRFVTCLPPERGGSGSPARFTAAGVVAAMEAAMETRGLGSVAGRRIAMQGGGAVGEEMIAELLARRVGSVVVAETSPERCEELSKRFHGEVVEVRRVEPDDASILAEPCDVLAPNALGGVLRPETILEVRAKVVCGASNNPLEDEERDARALAARGIAYVPDFVANQMGIVHCANEQYGYVRPDPALEFRLDPSREDSIPALIRRILREAEQRSMTTVEVATRLADELVDEPHPIWGDRARRVVDSLIEDRWHEG